MAKLSSDGKSVTVERGDTLWGIAQKYLGSGTKYKQLAAINNIPNPDLIYIGQVVKLSGTSSGGGSSSSTSNNTNAPVINQFGLLASSDDTLFATWTWGKEKNTESYKIVWTYTTIDGITFTEDAKSNTVDTDNYVASRQTTYSIPTNAVKVTFKVKPISKKYKSGNTEKTYFTANWSSIKTHTVSTPLSAPSAPSIELKELKLTAELENLDTVATAVQFRLVKNNVTIVETSKAISINKNTGYVSYVWPVVDTGCEYSVSCRFVRDALYSEWSPLSSSVSTKPDTPDKIITCKATDDDVVYLEWSKSSAATKYDIEYTTNQDYFDKSGETTTVTTENDGTGYYIAGMTTGEEYFFRVRAVNDSGESEWTEVVSLKLGEPPAAPTTWSSTTTAIIGEPVILYWNHNSEDGSSQTFAELMIYVDGVGINPSIIIENDRSEDDKDKTSSYSIDTSSYSEGVKMEWMVRTAGITNELGEWSIKRSIDIYAQPTIKLNVTDEEGNPLETITGFPFYITAIPGPKTQKPIGYHLSISSNEVYETADRAGNPILVNKDQKVYSRYFDTNTELVVIMSAGNVDLEKNVNYTVSCVVSMDSGLTAEATRDIFVDWDETVYSPNASIGIDEDSYTAYIQPYCEDRRLVYKQVTRSYNTYTVTDTVLDNLWGEPEVDTYTETGEQVYFGSDAEGNDIYFCQVEEIALVENVLLSVYRREFDGSFTEIATGLENKNVTVVDPHPALDYARYRIVATSIETGSVGYYDVPGYPVNGKSIIIQWDEEWSSFNTTSEDALEQPPWSGSLLKLPYNVDVSDTYAPDVVKVNYIGRSHPVTYYGTHQGHTASWNVAIEYTDKETLYALRRLAIWMGNVYVREPSGSGYWANVTVSFNQTHCELTIPVTLDITRVEGGV